jgi:hypothetical protein
VTTSSEKWLAPLWSRLYPALPPPGASTKNLAYEGSAWLSGCISRARPWPALIRRSHVKAPPFQQWLHLSRRPTTPQSCEKPCYSCVVYLVRWAGADPQAEVSMGSRSHPRLINSNRVSSQTSPKSGTLSTRPTRPKPTPPSRTGMISEMSLVPQTPAVLATCQ